VHPWLLTLPNGTQLPSWGFVVTSTIIVLGLVGHRMATREGLPKDTAMDVILIIFGGHLIGGRFGYVRANWHKFEDDPGKIFDLTQGGTAIIEAFLLITVLFFLYLWRKRLHLMQVADIAVPLVAIGQGLGRVGCLAAGCCHGHETDVPWAIVFTHPESRAPLNVPLHPTQVYEMVFGFAIGALLLWMRPRRTHYGVVAHWFLILWSISRFVLEFFRGDAKRGWFMEDTLGELLSIPQALCIFLLAWGIAGVVGFSRLAICKIPDGQIK